ncbi:hypothetical protein B0T19DRAFT_429189 [Cercophora scortea]|uniref:Uncharacterized protein n=1 Tax=Cercophora scortea TaxID=314031 RepID=A0AAE0IGJ2_9PEZI|nr:hypothetical protein B0T19DRAFT_429189 [Cercophora scortea]
MEGIYQVNIRGVWGGGRRGSGRGKQPFYNNTQHTTTILFFILVFFVGVVGCFVCRCVYLYGASFFISLFGFRTFFFLTLF